MKTKFADSRAWRSVLQGHAESLQLADSPETVVEIVRQALASLPGVGRGAVFLAAGREEVRTVARIDGPEAADLAAPGMELTGMARRALREKKSVQQAGVSAGTLWAAPLASPTGIHGAVAAVGGNEEIPGFLAHAGMALARETARAATGRAKASEERRLSELERAIAVLDQIVRDGRSDHALRRILGAFGACPALGRTTLWALRAEDGVYVEIARSENGNGGEYPVPPAPARRAGGLNAWIAPLPTFAGFSWEPAGPVRNRPGPGDTLFVPLGAPDAPHPIGFLLAEVRGPLEQGTRVEDLQRWAALARLALETEAEAGASLAKLDELREEKRQVADLHRMKSQFIAAVSHELRTPLTSISAYAETLRQSEMDDEPETRRKFLRVIHDESVRLARIVDDILDLATMDAGRVRLACRTLDVNEVVRDAYDVIRPIADRKNIRIVSPSADAAIVQADPDLIKQLAVNLLENAVKFSDEGGEVRIALEPGTNSVRLVVEDDGPGIPASELDVIFERFYQVDGTDAREHGGSGLGLAICRSIATWHDGRIWAESAVGQGARLVVSLPRVRAVSRDRAEEPTTKPAEPEEHRIPELVIEMIAEAVGAEAVSLMLLADEGDELFIQAAMGIPDDVIRDVRVALGDRIAGQVAESGRSLLIPDIEADHRFPSMSGKQYRTRSLLSVPVVLRGETIGVINVTNRITGEPFSAHDQRLVELMARRVALVLQKLREYGDRREAITRMEDAIRGVIDARRHYFPSRENTTRLMLDLCHEIGIDDDEATRIHYASILRDVGMTRLPDGVYRKPAALTREDREHIRRHPEEGARAIRPIELESGVFDLILSHHEEQDGSGYPRGLSGDGIPRGARILAVVDAYDALCTGRPYKKAVDVAAAVAELKRHAGTQFDEGVVEALVRVLEKRGDLEATRDDRHEAHDTQDPE